MSGKKISEGQITILNQILIISIHIASLVERPCYLLKLSSRNENMGMSRADNSVKMWWKGLVHEWPKSALFNILIKTLVNISQHGTSSKTTTTSLKTNHYGCYGNNNTLYMVYCKTVCFNQFHSWNLGAMPLKAFPFVSFIFVKYCSTKLWIKITITQKFLLPWQQICQIYYKKARSFT